MDITINILIGILAGVVAGIHSGTIVARMSKFEEIRNQIKRIVWNIDFTYSSGKPTITPNKKISELIFLSSDLYALKHPTAGKQVSILQNTILSTLQSPPKEFEQMNELYSEWQKVCRNIKPNYRVIFSLNPWV